MDLGRVVNELGPVVNELGPVVSGLRPAVQRALAAYSTAPDRLFN
ncbi:hypothetical protein [Nonomuraea sp. NPDC049028]